MTRLIRACPWATYDTSIAAANLEVLSRLARQTTSFDLIAGRDLLEPGAASILLVAMRGLVSDGDRNHVRRRLWPTAFERGTGEHLQSALQLLFSL